MLTLNPKYQFTREELYDLGLKDIGENVVIDRSARMYNCENIHIRSNVRIDAYCVLSAGAEGIYLGNHNHLSVGVSILGPCKVVLDDFCGLSAKTSVFTSTDDFVSGALTNPTIPDEFLKVFASPVTLGKHVVVGAGSVILPGVNIGLGATVGSLSLVNKSVPDFWIVIGIPIKKIGMRDRSILQNEINFINYKNAQKLNNFTG